jgi:hypothetical protein
LSRKKSSAVSAAPRTEDDSHQVIADLIAMAGRMLSVTPGGRRESAKKLVHELIDVAFQAIDESFVRSHLLAVVREDHRVVTRGAIAAALFVRNGEMALRKLLPDVDPDKIEDRFRLRLDKVFDQGLRISLRRLRALGKNGSLRLHSPAGRGPDAFCTIDRQDTPSSSRTSAP